MKSPVEVAAWLAARFEEDGLDYALGGAMALSAWSAPRQTLDVDVLVFVDDRSVARVIDSLERAGALVDRDDATRRAASTGMFMAQLGTIRVDVFLAAHPIHDPMKERRRQVELGGVMLWFVSAEDIAIFKLFYGRPKDLIDLERLFQAQPELDTSYIDGALRTIVPRGDRRLDILDELRRRGR
jgi:hypothetical protein